ncbi:MAG: prolipoprotein diacylglyceryl transferase [Gaiella sp.]
MSLLATIPSPSSGTFDLGPLEIHMYGLMLLLAIAAATAIAGRRFVGRGGGDWDLILRLAIWGVGWGIVGARAYHLLTSWSEVPDEWWGPFAIWKGGLGVWGGIAAGCVAGAIVARRAGADVALLASCLAPGLLVAQGVGRLGNWFNQELFGKPTDLPWALEVSAGRVFEAGYPAGTTFHPTFLYELLWDLFAAALLVFVIERRFKPRPPGLFALYVALYCFGRFWVEILRIDQAHELLGLRLNAWVSLAGIVLGTLWFIGTQRGDGSRRWPGVRLPWPWPRRHAAAKPPPAMAVPKGRVRPRS